MARYFGIKCRCLEQEDLVESPEEQVAHLFNKENDKEKDIVVEMLGVEFWSEGHVHDGLVMESLFEPIVQVLGHAISTNGIVRRMVQEDLTQGVFEALDTIEVVMAFGCMLGFFYLNVEGKKKKMQKSQSLFKAGIVKEYSMEKFEAFMQENKGFMPKEIVEKVVQIGEGIKYLYN